MSYKSIINQHSAQTQGEAGQVAVPALILAIEGPTNVDTFNELKTQTSYLYVLALALSRPYHGVSNLVAHLTRYRTLKLCQSCASHINISSQPAARPTVSPRKASKDSGKAMKKEPSANNAHDLFWARTKRERKLQACPKPVIVVTRAVPPGRTRVLFSKPNMKRASAPYRRYLSQVLPRLDVHEPASQESDDNPAMLIESVRNIAYLLQRKYGRPSFRLALGQTGAYLLGGSTVPVAALQTVCGNQLLAPVIQHVRRDACSLWTLLARY